jgi:2-polyprenyl-6-methoxyphenol hydroxylase-like FAD-dependent oxidoreductase
MEITGECNSRQDFDAQVLIAGGSVVGLSAAAFLAVRGIKTLLVERRSDLSRRLRAKVFYARTLELYRTIGIDQRILDAEPKEARPTDIAIVESLGGSERRRWSVPATRDLGELSPCRSVFIKQRNLEEIVRQRARTRRHALLWDRIAGLHAGPPRCGRAGLRPNYRGGEATEGAIHDRR